MDWMNMPLIEAAFAVGSAIGFLVGCVSASGIESWKSWHRGYNEGYRRGYNDRAFKVEDE